MKLRKVAKFHSRRIAVGVTNLPISVVNSALLYIVSVPINALIELTAIVADIICIAHSPPNVQDLLLFYLYIFLFNFFSKPSVIK